VSRLAARSLYRRLTSIYNDGAIDSPRTHQRESGEGADTTLARPPSYREDACLMAERAPYSRVYWGIVDDPKFSTIYDDDHHLAAWLRMLVVADQSYPTSAQVPANIRRASVKALSEAHLITVTGRRFRIVGLDAERERRSESARNAAAWRWQSERSAPASDPHSDRNANGLLGRGRGLVREKKGEQGASPLEGRPLRAVVDPKR